MDRRLEPSPAFSPGERAGLTSGDVSDLSRRSKTRGWGQGRGAMGKEVCSEAKRGDLVTVGKNGCFIAGSL